MLKRQVETKTQVGLTRDGRKKNIKNAFSANFPEVSGKTIILVDDVYTTGATMGEACRVSKKMVQKVVWDGNCFRLGGLSLVSRYEFDNLRLILIFSFDFKYLLGV